MVWYGVVVCGGEGGGGAEQLPEVVEWDSVRVSVVGDREGVGLGDDGV